MRKQSEALKELEDEIYPLYPSFEPVILKFEAKKKRITNEELLQKLKEFVEILNKPEIVAIFKRLANVEEKRKIER